MYDARIMRRTTIMLPDDLDASLRLEARRRGVSIAELAREAIEAQLREAGPRRLSFIGIGEGDGEDVAARSEEFVAAAIRRRHRR
jgi:hypothetical protein